MSVTEANKEQGAAFEDLFKRQAQRLGLTAIKNPLSCKILWGGRIQLIHGQLDFQLINRRDGRVGFFDCKSYNADFFTFSDLHEDQVKQAVVYNDCRVPSGFVAWFIPANAVVYFPGHVIAEKGPRSRFERKDGVFLGRYENFNLKALLRVQAPVSPIS